MMTSPTRKSGKKIGKRPSIVLEHKESLEDDYRKKNLETRKIQNFQISQNKHFLDTENRKKSNSRNKKSMKSFNDIDEDIKIMFDNSPAKRVQRILHSRNQGPKKKKEKTKSFFVSRKRMNNKMPKASVQITGITRNPFSDQIDNLNLSPPKHNQNLNKMTTPSRKSKKFKSMAAMKKEEMSAKNKMYKKPLFSKEGPSAGLSRVGRRRGGA